MFYAKMKNNLRRKNMFKIIVTLLFVAFFTLSFVSEKTYDRNAVFCLRKDGTAAIELNGHYFDVDLSGHAEDCPCYEYVIDPCYLAD